MWELIALGCLILFVTGIAMRKTKRQVSEFATFSNGNTVDTDELARKIGIEVGKEFRAALEEFRDALQNITINTSNPHVQIGSASAVEMDESIIPANLKVDILATNLDGATREEKVIDKQLQKSKSKLAAIKKEK